MTNKPTTDWEKRFDEKFTFEMKMDRWLNGDARHFKQSISPLDVKRFIAQERATLAADIKQTLIDSVNKLPPAMIAPGLGNDWVKRTDVLDLFKIKIPT